MSDADADYGWGEKEDFDTNHRNNRMSDNDARANGALFTNERKQKDNHPDFRGNIEIPEALLRQMVELRQKGQLPILEIAGWKREGKEPPHRKYLGLSLSVDDYKMKQKYGEDASTGSDPFDDALPDNSGDGAADDDPFA